MADSAAEGAEPPDDEGETARPGPMDELSSHPPAKPLAADVKKRIFDSLPDSKSTSPIADVPPEEVDQALEPLDEAIAAQTAEPVATAGEADVNDDEIEFGPESSDDAPYSSVTTAPKEPSEDFGLGPPIDGNHGEGMFPTVTEAPRETSGHISVDKSVDDLEREAIRASLAKLGIRVPQRFKTKIQEWRDLRTVFLERSLSLEETPLKRALLIYLRGCVPETAGLEPSILSRDARSLTMLTIAALKKRKRLEVAQALEDQLSSVPSRTSPPAMPPPPSQKKT
ncbi:MAG: hypothetical protein WC766_04705 [Patescibacteria group bacterium]